LSLPGEVVTTDGLISDGVAGKDFISAVVGIWAGFSSAIAVLKKQKAKNNRQQNKYLAEWLIKFHFASLIIFRM